MTLDTFVSQFNGRYVDYDGSFGGQCVDLISFYCRDVINVPAGTGNAINWTPRGGFNKYGKITPIKGDVIVYGTSYSPYGHISISLGGEGVFEQNGYQGRNQAGYNNPGDNCRIVNRNLNGVINVFRPINQPNQPPQEEVPMPNEGDAVNFIKNQRGDSNYNPSQSEIQNAMKASYKDWAYRLSGLNEGDAVNMLNAQGLPDTAANKAMMQSQGFKHWMYDFSGKLNKEFVEVTDKLYKKK